MTGMFLAGLAMIVVAAAAAIVAGLHYWRLTVEQRARLELIDRETARMVRSLRRAQQTPREGVQAGLELIQLVASGRLFKSGRAPTGFEYHPGPDEDWMEL